MFYNFRVEPETSSEFSLFRSGYDYRVRGCGVETEGRLSEESRVKIHVPACEKPGWRMAGLPEMPENLLPVLVKIRLMNETDRLLALRLDGQSRMFSVVLPPGETRIMTIPREMNRLALTGCDSGGPDAFQA